MKKKYLKLLKWYGQNYGMTLFSETDLETVVDEFIKMDEKISDEVCNIILNDLSARKESRLLKLNPDRRKLIKKVFNQGYEINDFIEVNRCMCNKWKNDKEMRDYLTPETLYSSKFTKYREMAEEEQFEPAADRIRKTTLEARKLIGG